MIRHWCDALEDANPVYTDEAFARSSLHAGIVAPPAMLPVWTMPGLRPEAEGPRTPAAVRDVLEALDEAGFSSVVATNCSLEWRRLLRLGEHVTSTRQVDWVSDEKQTALGSGRFLEEVIRYRDQAGGAVAHMRFRMLKFRPLEPTSSEAKEADRAAEATAASANPAGASRRITLRYDEVREGDRLSELRVPITTTRIIAGTIAARDYQDVHHDPRLAVQRGSKDIFMNIFTSIGYVCRLVTDWAGPEACLLRLDLRLGVPNHPGDVMTLSGEVSGRSDGILEVSLRGANRLGNHVNATLALSLPE